jgi:hypothetical protein
MEAGPRDSGVKVGWGADGRNARGRWGRLARRIPAPALIAVLAALGAVVLVGALATLPMVRAAAAASKPPGEAAQSQPGASSDAGAQLPGDYVDSRLGFSLRLPSGWVARPQPGVHTWAGQTDERIGVVELYDPTHPADQLELGITESPTMPAAFARLGTPDTRLGPYPAFNRDVTPDDGSSPCVIRIYLARLDYIVARACGAGIASRTGQFQSVLGSYTPNAAKAAASAMAAGGVHGLAAPVPPAQPKTCTQLVVEATSRPADRSNWGRELIGANDNRWSPYPTPGVSVCSNFTIVNGRLVSFPGPTFQCVELTNRFLREQWGHGGVGGNAAAWFDYYDATGKRHDGYARLYPDAQLSEDASQGHSAFRPQPGDILVWQDVQDGKHWNSGLRRSPGHVAIITGTDAGHVYMMQQNYNERSAYMSLPLAAVANGWQITDHSGVAGRIVRGWIHFIENGGPAGTSLTPTPSPPGTPPAPIGTPANAQDLYAVGADGQLYDYHWGMGAGWSSAQRVSETGTQGGPSLAGTPSLNVYALSGEPYQSVFATGGDGHLYEYWQGGSGGWHRNDLSAMTPLPDGVSVTGAPIALTYALPADATAGATGEARMRHAVYVAASDGNLYRFTWTQSGGWTTPTPLSTTATPGATVSGMSAITWVQADAGGTAGATTSGQTREEALYVLRSDGHLYEYLSSDGATWQQTDLSAATSAPSATSPSLAGAPAASVFVPSGEQAAHRVVFATGADGHLYGYTYTPSSGSGPGAWAVADVSHASDGPQAGGAGSTAGVTIVGSPSVPSTAASGQSASSLPDVFAAGSDGHLHGYSYAQGWHGADVSAAASQPAGATLGGSPTSYSYAISGDAVARLGVFAVTQSGTLAELVAVPTTSGAPARWLYIDHGAPGATTLAGTLAGAAFTR